MIPADKIRRSIAPLLASLAFCPVTNAATPAELEAAYTAQARTPANPDRGQALFTSRHGRDWSCSSCHSAVPIQAGSHAATGKPIAALAPAFNADRFADAAGDVSAVVGAAGQSFSGNPAASSGLPPRPAGPQAGACPCA